MTFERRPQNFSDIVMLFENMGNALYESLNMTREEQILAMEGALQRIREKSADENKWARRVFADVGATVPGGK